MLPKIKVLVINGFFTKAAVRWQISNIYGRLAITPKKKTRSHKQNMNRIGKEARRLQREFHKEGEYAIPREITQDVIPLHT